MKLSKLAEVAGAIGAGCLMLSAAHAAQNAVAGALGAAAQPKVEAAKAAVTVTPGADPGAPPTQAEALAAAIAGRNFNAIIANGGTAQDVAMAIRPGSRRDSPDITSARFFRQGDRMGIVFDRNGGLAESGKTSWDGAPPEVLNGLPPYEQVFIPPPYMAQINQLLLTGGAATDAARLFVTDEQIPITDVSASRFVQSSMGGVALAIPDLTRPGYPPTLLNLPGTDDFPGLASLPTTVQAFPVEPLKTFKPLPEIPADWLKATPAKPG